MNTQERMVDWRTFRIAAIAVAVVAVLVLAAYLFGNSLQADTSASVAPSPLGSSLTNSRQSAAVAPSFTGASSLDSRGARTTLSAERAAALAALAKSAADFHAEQNAAAEAARWAAVAAADKDLARFYSAVIATNAAADQARPAAADPYQNEWMGFTSPESVGAGLPSVGDAGGSGSPSIKPEGIETGGVLFAAPGQYQWIKPEGITASGTK
jgi:hypothetical protein